MKHSLDLNTFVKTLTNKGFDGFFLTESDYAGKLKESISEFLQAWEDGTDAPLVANKLHLSTYLDWNGENQPRVDCNMWVKYENGTFDLQESEMYIKRTDRFGQILKETKLTNLTASSFPTKKEAIAMVSDLPKKKSLGKRGFRM